MIGITEHAPAMPGACKTSYFRSLSLAPRVRFGVTLLYGAEVNILDNKGTLDLEFDILESLDLNIASLHTKCLTPGDMTFNTTAYIEAMKHPHIHMIGHPDDVAFPVDYEKLVIAAKKYHVLLEINNASLSPEGYRGDVRNNVLQLLSYCRQFQHPIVLSSDSHGKEQIGHTQYIYPLLRETNFPPSLVLNRCTSSFLDYLKE